jgi:tetratricopeptide (TPR) repeat protein
MNFDEFLKSAWKDHGDHAPEVADKIASSLNLVETPDQIPALAGLITHVLGEHLGEWQRGLDLLESLRALPAFDGSAAIAGPLTRSVATLRYARGDAEALAALVPAERVSPLANAASILAGRRQYKPAIAAYRAALQLAQTGVPLSSPAIRALAIGGNNLAAALEEKSDRDAEENEGMVAAAEGGLTYWKQAGTWLEEERAEYRLARSLLRAGRPEPAIQSARRCLEVCRSNEAPAFEQFFGHAVLALAHRAAGDHESFATARNLAMVQWEQLPVDERKWCESERNELGV